MYVQFYWFYLCNDFLSRHSHVFQRKMLEAHGEWACVKERKSKWVPMKYVYGTWCISGCDCWKIHSLCHIHCDEHLISTTRRKNEMWLLGTFVTIMSIRNINVRMRKCFFRIWFSTNHSTMGHKKNNRNKELIFNLSKKPHATVLSIRYSIRAYWFVSMFVFV